MGQTTEKKHVKFLQCGDIHLDTPYTGLSAEKSEERRRELRNSFSRMMQYVRDRGVDVVLMCGDIFDTEYATNTTAEVLIREFRNCPDATFVITPGSSDAYENNPIYTSGRLPENCHVIKNEHLCSAGSVGRKIEGTAVEGNVSVYIVASLVGTVSNGECACASTLAEAEVNVFEGIGDSLVSGSVFWNVKLGRCLFTAENYVTVLEYKGSGAHFASGSRLAVSIQNIRACGKLEAVKINDHGSAHLADIVVGSRSKVGKEYDLSGLCIGCNSTESDGILNIVQSLSPRCK